MRRAYLLVRRGPLYRREAFESGLKAAGFQLMPEAYPDARGDRAGDVLVIWNRYGDQNDMASRFEKCGGTVIVAENGYLGANGGSPKFQIARGPDQGHYIALSVGQHNGAGRTPTPTSDDTRGRSRFHRLGVELKPWRLTGEHILICGQRGVGSPLMASPPGWHDRARAFVSSRTKRPVKVRLHPGNNEPGRPLEVDLENAWACVIWSSSSGVRALTLGIPVYFDAPHWICEWGAERLDKGGNFENPKTSDEARRLAMARMSWGQFTIEEIARGYPFTLLMDECRTNENAASL